MNEFWIKIKPSEHAIEQATKRNIRIPAKVNLADKDVRMVKDTDTSMVIYVPLYQRNKQFDYYKRIPVTPVGHDEVEAISIMLRETRRIGKAKPFSTDFLFDLRKLGLL